MLSQIPTVEEVADYLKLLGFEVERDGESWIYNISISQKIIAQMYDQTHGVALHLYGESTDSMLLSILSKSYTVTSFIGNKYIYDITNSNSRRSN